MGLELFQRAADARGRIVRVEQLLSAGAEENPAQGVGYLLTFDVGRILVAADPAHERLSLHHVETAEEIEAIKRVSLDEAEPWWRVAGNEITRVWPAGQGAGAEGGSEDVREVRIQFREDSESPRVISLRYEAGAVHVGEELNDGG